MPVTRAEATGYTETSRHADVVAFLRALGEKADPRLWIGSIGESPEGRDLPLCVLSAHGVHTPEAAAALGLPVVLFQCGIHAGEVEGKEAVLMLMRDLLGGPEGALLEHTTLVVLPLFNPDGNDRIDAGNRALHLPKLNGQLGPDSGVGTRTNAAKINLNRDYLRADADEMQLWHQRVWQAWQPDLTLDNHATNGSVHRFAMTVDVPHVTESGRAEPIEYVRGRLVPEVIAAVKGTTGYDSGWYGNFVEDERVLDADGEADPVSVVREGWMTYPHHPRFGANYRGLCGRMDLLLEAYSYIPFADRVKVAYAWMLESLRFAAANAAEIVAINRAARTPPARVAVRYELRVADAAVEVLTREPRTLDGAPTAVTLPHFARFVGTTVVERPRAYAVAPSVAAKLVRHGLVLTREEGPVAVQVPVVNGYGRTGGRAILEAAATGDVAVAWKDDTRPLPPDWELVLTDQPHGAVAVYLCEPESDDGPLENGLCAAPPVGAELPIWRVR